MNQPSTLGQKIPAGTRLVSYDCPSCGHHESAVFYEVRNVPVHSCLMMPSHQEAVDFPCGDVVLGFCPNCGFVTNVEFDANNSDYSPIYEDQQSFSPTFNSFAYKLATRLIEKYDLRNKKIVEIGCSKGDFLLLMCELGNNYGVGIDPSAIVGRVESAAAERVMFIQDYYSEKYSEHTGEFICCRHTLEHIHQTADLVRTVRRSVGDRLDTVIFFEIPDMGRVLIEQAFEDIYYEHCSYFTPGSLARLFRQEGFEVLDVYLDYGDQYLMIEARPVATPSTKIHPAEESVEQLVKDVELFASKIGDKLGYWKQHLETMKADGKKVAVWGSGSKCVAFLTTLGTKDLIDWVVDINPHRHGRFIPGVGQEIRSPESLKDYQPDEVIVMNAIYCDEIQKMLDDMGVTTKVVAI
ncbi:MAG: methyltransferase domain-containing protein [Myxacorys chilensis ATA2-1-KO14]|nr:methyltransferase domain-containing protein [Myxacorys chilensis ATA2-1-KO14]